MLRAIFRTLSLICLAMALVAGVLDVTRSIADSRVVVTPLLIDWVRFGTDSLEGFRQVIIEWLHPVVWDPVFMTILKAPTWLVFAVLSILFGLLAYRRRRRWQENYMA